MTIERRMPLVIGIGELLWDLLPDERRLGGAPANFAYHAAMQGAEAYVVSAVGDDSDGRDIVAELEQRGMAIEHIAVISEVATGTVSVELTEGVPTYTINYPAAWDFIPFVSGLSKLAGRADAICFGTLAQRSELSRTTLRRFLAHAPSCCLKVLDLNLRQKFFSVELVRDSLQLCNVLKVSDEELATIASLLGIGGDMDEVITFLVQKYQLKYAVVTKGCAGSVFYDGKDFLAVPAVDFGPVVDTVGCGDSFTAVLITGLLLGIEPQAAMRHAAAIAGFVCANKGATPLIPEHLKIRAAGSPTFRGDGDR